MPAITHGSARAFAIGLAVAMLAPAAAASGTTPDAPAAVDAESKRAVLDLEHARADVTADLAAAHEASRALFQELKADASAEHEAALELVRAEFQAALDEVRLLLESGEREAARALYEEARENARDQRKAAHDAFLDAVRTAAEESRALYRAQADAIRESWEARAEAARAVLEARAVTEYKVREAMLEQEDPDARSRLDARHVAHVQPKPAAMEACASAPAAPDHPAAMEPERCERLRELHEAALEARDPMPNPVGRCRMLLHEVASGDANETEDANETGSANATHAEYPDDGAHPAPAVRVGVHVLDVEACERIVDEHLDAPSPDVRDMPLDELATACERFMEAHARAWKRAHEHGGELPRVDVEGPDGIHLTVGACARAMDAAAREMEHTEPPMHEDKRDLHEDRAVLKEACMELEQSGEKALHVETDGFEGSVDALKCRDFMEDARDAYERDAPGDAYEHEYDDHDGFDDERRHRERAEPKMDPFLVWSEHACAVLDEGSITTLRHSSGRTVTLEDCPRAATSEWDGAHEAVTGVLS